MDKHIKDTDYKPQLTTVIFLGGPCWISVSGFFGLFKRIDK